MLTVVLMENLFPTKGLEKNKQFHKFNLVHNRKQLVDAMNRILPKYGINTYKRICAFLGNCGIETDYFRTTSEYASGWDYDISVNPTKARGLGNLVKGDGPKYKGGGLTQTTGKNNYRALNPIIGKRLGIDFTKNPEKLHEINIAVESACIFWQDNNLNSFADKGEFKQLSAIVNRGDKNKTPLHWAKRNELYSLCLRRIPKDFSITLPLQSEAKSSQQLAVAEPIEEVGLLHENSAESLAIPVLQSNEQTEPLEQLIEKQSNEQPLVSNEKEPDFLNEFIDKNVTSDHVKTASVGLATKFWRRLARPLVLLYAALEAGNIYAWLGVIVSITAAGLTIYWHRKEIKKLYLKLKTKLTS